MTGQRRNKREINAARQSPALPSESRAPAPSGRWVAGGAPTDAAGVAWIVRPMPDGQWPPEHDAPRDDSFAWWVRSACGHPGGHKQWAFYHRRDAEVYEWVFREDPCRFTRCPHRVMIENEKRSRG